MTSGADLQSSVISKSENLIVSTLDSSIINLNLCIEETGQKQSSILRSGDKNSLISLGSVVSSIQGRYLASRGL